MDAATITALFLGAGGLITAIMTAAVSARKAEIESLQQALKVTQDLVEKFRIELQNERTLRLSLETKVADLTQALRKRDDELQEAHQQIEELQHRMTRLRRESKQHSEGTSRESHPPRPTSPEEV